MTARVSSSIRVTNAPVRPAAGRILPGILISRQTAGAVKVLQQRASAEPGRGRSDLPGATAQADAAHEADVQIPAAGTARSRGAGVAEQTSETAPEPGLIQTRAFLPSPGSSPE